MTHIAVKPKPGLDPKAAKLLVHPVSGGLLDAAGSVPEAGRPWLYDGFTCRLLTDGAIVRAESETVPGFTSWASDRLAEQAPAPEPTAAH